MWAGCRRLRGNKAHGGRAGPSATRWYTAPRKKNRNALPFLLLRKISVPELTRVSVADRKLNFPTKSESARFSSVAGVSR